MSFLRTFQHLLPRSQAWRLTAGKQLRQFFEGLANSLEFEVEDEETEGRWYYGPRKFFDLIWLDLFAATTRELEAWEKEKGLFVAAGDSEATRRANLDAEWKAQGGQDPAYIQEILQAAGFDLYVHEWWSSDHPYVVRDPRNYADQPLIGTVRCRPHSDPNEARCTASPSTWRCNAFLNNEPRYLVNEDLSQRAPPPIPEDPKYWPYFIYIGPETLEEKDHPDALVNIPTIRQYELRRLLLKLCPNQQWIVLMVDWVGEGVFTPPFDLTFE